MTLPPARGETLADFRVLVIAEHPLLPTSAAVGAALDRLSKQLVAAGAAVRQESPLLPDLATSARLYVKLLNAVLTAGMPDDRYQEERIAAESIPAADQSLVAELLRGALMSHRDWLRADFARQRLKQKWRTLFQDFDVVLCPVAATTAFPHDHSEPQTDRTLVVDGKDFPYLQQLAWADPATTFGLPATVIPIGIMDGLPVGMQIIGPEYEDRTTLAFAGLVERAFGGFTPPPGYV